MIESVKDIVRRASGFMVKSGFETASKGGIVNIVTSSDIAVQNFLVSELSALLPGCGFICEEEERHDPHKEYVWIIDPIDGTANYSRGIDHCSISVALKKNEEVILGVVYSPWRDEIYWAEKGKGAFRNQEPIRVSSRLFSDGLLCTALSLYRKEYGALCSEVIMDIYDYCNDVRRFGSAAIEICFLASGLCDLYFEFRLQPWDYSAAMLILEEAGGKLSNLDGCHPSFYEPDIVCGANSEKNMEQLLQIVRRHINNKPYKD